MLELNKVYNEDCLKVIELMDDNSLDLVLTSPPYNVNLGQNKYNKNKYALYNDNKEHKDYIDWLKLIFKNLFQKLKVGGRVVINIGDGKNGACPTHSDIIQFMTKELSYIPMTEIIWNKSQVGSRTAWGSFNSPSSPSFPTPFEYVLVFAKETTKLQYKGESDLTKEEFIPWSLAIWNIAPETKMNKVYGHPAMFPKELAKRCIKMFTYKGATIFDPFNGAGTTCVVAKNLGRNFIGSDISLEYCNTTNKRLVEEIDVP